MSSAAGEERNRVFVKVLVLGQSNVGKSSLIERYCKDHFTAERRMTIGADFMTKVLDNISEDSQVVMQIWDTAGQERFTTSALSNAFYRGSDGALLVYDATNEKSAEQLAMWRDEVCLNDNNTKCKMQNISPCLDSQQTI